MGLAVQPCTPCVIFVGGSGWAAARSPWVGPAEQLCTPWVIFVGGSGWAADLVGLLIFSKWELTMAALIGAVGEFDAETEGWTQYAECLSHFFEANLIVDEERKKHFS